MTRSLIIAHQCTVDTLQRLEGEEVRQLPTNSDPLSPPLTPGLPPIGRVVRTTAGHKPSLSFDNQKFRLPSPAGVSGRERASVWINDLIFDNSPLPAGFRRQTWGDAECSLFLDQQPYYFLQKWTDQGEHLNELRRKDIEQPLLYGTHDPLAGGGDCETEPSALEDLGLPLKRDTMKLQAEYWPPIIPRSDSKKAPAPRPPPLANSSHVGSMFPLALKGDCSDLVNLDIIQKTANNTDPTLLPAALRKK
jgi:hypothetical protein